MELEKAVLISVIGFFGSIIFYFLKDIFVTIKQLKQFDIDNKVKIKDNFFISKINIDKLKETKIILDTHEKRLDNNVRRINNISGKVRQSEKQIEQLSKTTHDNEANIKTIAVTHNSTACGKLTQVTLEK